MIEAGLGIWAVAIPAILLALLALAEYAQPRRALVLGRHPRWRTHALFFLTNAVVGRLLALVMVVGVAAQWSADFGFGLFHLASWPWWIEASLAFIILDFAVWLQHLLMHRWPLLWRMHKVHHSDRDLDATTALRFHPFELIVSTLYKSAWVALLGVPVTIALVFEIWLNANSLFNHSNIRLPRWLDRALRPVVVTPDMHLVHHSTLATEQHCNYGFALTIWDRISGSYAARSVLGEQQQIGLAETSDTSPGQFLWSMKLPLT
ncbi:MAG: sterol desaturase family protein [Sphingomonadaceae bacterium]|nr:sterol desaturase family protein [Sphingomonadaceae bacterium]